MTTFSFKRSSVFLDFQIMCVAASTAGSSMLFTLHSIEPNFNWFNSDRGHTSRRDSACHVHSLCGPYEVHSRNFSETEIRFSLEVLKNRKNDSAELIHSGNARFAQSKLPTTERRIEIKFAA